MHGRQEGAHRNAVEQLRPPQDPVVIRDTPLEGRRNWTHEPTNFTVRLARSGGRSSESRQRMVFFTNFDAVAFGKWGAKLLAVVSLLIQACHENINQKGATTRSKDKILTS